MSRAIDDIINQDSPVDSLVVDNCQSYISQGSIGLGGICLGDICPTIITTESFGPRNCSVNNFYTSRAVSGALAHYLQYHNTCKPEIDPSAPKNSKQGLERALVF